MQYNAIVQAQKAMRSLRIQVKSLLKRQPKQSLPSIDRRFSVPLSVKLYSPTFRYNKKLKSQANSSCEKALVKQFNKNISEKEKEESRINLIAFKNKFNPENQIKLDVLQGKERSMILEESLKKPLKIIEKSLIEKIQRNPKQATEESNIIYNCPKKLQSNHVSRKSRFVNKTMLENSLELQVSASKVETNRKSCYSPWKLKEDSQFIYVHEHI